MLNQLLCKMNPAIRHSIIYGLSIALMKSVSLIMLPITAHYLTPNEFGQLELLTSIGIVCSILVGLGLEHTLFRFASGNGDIKKNKQGAAAILTLSLIAGMIALGGFWLITPTIIANISVDISELQLRLILTVISLEGAVAIPLAWLRMNDKVLSFFLATSLRTVAQALLIVLFLMSGFGVDGVLEACLIAAVVQALILSALMIADVGMVFKFSQFKKFLFYSLPIVASGIIAFTLAGLDRWLLAAFRPLSDVAIYGIAAKFAIATVLLVQPFGMWWLPKRLAIIKQQGGEKIAAHYISIGIMIVMVVAVFVSLVSPFLIHWLLAPTYHQAIDYVLWLILAMAFKEIGELVNIGCFIGKSTYLQLAINTICAAVGLTTMWLGIEDWGITAVVAALNFAYLSKAILFFIVSQRLLPLPYNKSTLLIVIALGVSLIGLSQYISINIEGLISAMFVLVIMALVISKQNVIKQNQDLG